MRFRKSIRIMKGVRINFSKSGISTTIGGRGCSVNISSRGTYLNTSIPGLGLYDRKKISGPSTSNKPKSNSSAYRPKPTTQPIGEFKVSVQDDGSVIIKNSLGSIITDETLLRKIKRTTEYKNLKNQLMGQLKADIDNETNNIVEIYKLSAVVPSYNDYQTSLTNLKPLNYCPLPYTEAAPDKEKLLAQITDEAKQCVKTLAFWKLNQLRNEYVMKELSTRYEHQYNDWEIRKKAHEDEQLRIGDEQNAIYLNEYECQKKYLEDAIEGTREFIEAEIDYWISSLELPVDFNVQFEYDFNNSCVLLDLDLPEIEDMPTEKAVELASGTVKRKDKTQKEIKYDYMRCVYGLGVFFASHIFKISPMIRDILVSGYTQRRNKAGDIQDDYVYSTKFKRLLFENVDFQNIDLLDFWGKFENRCLPTQTYELKTIVPYENISNKSEY